MTSISKVRKRPGGPKVWRVRYRGDDGRRYSRRFATLPAAEAFAFRQWLTSWFLKAARPSGTRPDKALRTWLAGRA